MAKSLAFFAAAARASPGGSKNGRGGNRPLALALLILWDARVARGQLTFGPDRRRDGQVARGQIISHAAVVPIYKGYEQGSKQESEK